MLEEYDQDTLRALMERSAIATFNAMRDAGMLDGTETGGTPRSPDSMRAERMMRDGATAEEARAACNLTWNEMEAARRAVRGHKRKGPKPGTPRRCSPAGIEARRLAAEGKTAAEIVRLTGVGESTAQRIVSEARKMASQRRGEAPQRPVEASPVGRCPGEAERASSGACSA